MKYKTEDFIQAVMKRCPKAEVIQETGNLIRILMYDLRDKLAIGSLIDNTRNFKIVKISDYPNRLSKEFPVSVYRVKKLRITKKNCKKK